MTIRLHVLFGFNHWRRHQPDSKKYHCRKRSWDAKRAQDQRSLTMYFGLSEEQQFFQESIKKFLDDTVTVDSLRSFRDGENENLFEIVYKGLNELGLCGLIIPEKYGGLGLDSLFAISVSESLGRGIAPYPFIGSFLIAPFLIDQLGSDSQKEKYLPGIATGEIRFAVALSEMTGRRSEIGIESSNHQLNGQTLFVMDDIESTHYLIVDSDAGIHIVDSSESGLEKIKLSTVDITSFISELILSEVKTEHLGSGSENEETVKRAIDLGRVAIAADTLGASQCMLNQSIDYSKDRKQFGRPIGSFQAVKHMCAQMASDLEPCHSLVWYAAHSLDHIAHESHLMACQTKAHVSEVGAFVAKTATEVHGGMGFTDDLGLHFWFKRIGLNRQLLGSPDLLREEAAEAQGI